MSKRQFHLNRQRRDRKLRQRQRRLMRVSGTGAAVGATVLFTPAAEAATFTVSNTGDSGAGSLRQAVLDANAAAGADAISFQSGLSGSITLASRLEVYEAVDIQGPGASQLTVSGNDLSQIFYVNADTNGAEDDVVSISGLTLAHGNADSTGGDGAEGGAVKALLTDIRVSDMVFDANHASGDGGALYSDSGPTRIVRSTFTGNSANTGGAVYTDGDTSGDTSDVVEITDSVFTQNTAETYTAGAIYIDDATGGAVTIVGTTVANNQAANAAGGILFYGPEGGPVTVRNSTISGNTTAAGAPGDNYHGGAGVFIERPEQPVTFENTTISNNTASTGVGGGVSSYNDLDVLVTFRNSTVAGNTAPDGGGIFRLGEDDASPGDDTVALSSTIVADNAGGDLRQGPPPIVGTFDSSFSLVEDPGAVAFTDGGSNILSTDPQLGPLAANGGPTQTMLPALSSPVIDAGIANGLATDQRGLARTADLTAVANRTGSDATDIGAVEIEGAACQGPVVPAKTGSDADDILTGSTGPDSLSGLGGNDTLKAQGGNDCVSGGDGNDKGRGQGGKDTVKGDAGKDNVAGGGKNDKVIGGDGNDTVKGGGGKDTLKGNAGKDKLSARDGAKDKVNCGAGKDKATVDAKDKVSKNCETVSEG